MKGAAAAVVVIALAVLLGVKGEDVGTWVGGMFHGFQTSVQGE